LSAGNRYFLLSWYVNMPLFSPLSNLVNRV
jgi:hypothetical protein